MESTFNADPLEYFPYEVSERILSYLSVKNLMRVSAVNSLWYDFIGQSKRLMKNVKIKIRNQDYKKRTICHLLTSTRNYETFEIDTMDLRSINVIFELLQSQQWRNVIIKNLYFTTASQAHMFFSLIQDSVRSLEMRGAYILYPNGIDKNHGLVFPNLRRFTAITTKSAYILLEMFQNVRHLTHFSLKSAELNEAASNAVMEILKSNDKLEVLNISNAALFPLLYLDKITIPCKLRQLSILNENNREGRKNSENFIALLQDQRESLQTIILDKLFEEDVLKAIYALPKLRMLSIKEFTNIDAYNNLMLTRSKSIKQLYINVLPENFNLLKAIIVATPNLYSLTVLHMNYKFMKFISKNLPNLRGLSIGFPNISYLPRGDIFKNLGYLYVQNYKPSLRKSILRRKFHSLSNFEQLLFRTLA
ncbi:unnamed protein product [Chironomus riparius]|uniref:F-box domain-containing protein n=1 Tax=Chironomus riparius TaxID=315576 RepID=A0A9N9WUB9_9DIPT|nr:unnamed protein product [Chironomus riparius]